MVKHGRPRIPHQAYLQPPLAPRCDANPGKIPTCIQVSVRPETTGTLKTMLVSCTQLTASRAGLARVGRIRVLHHDAHRPRLVFHKALQLAEGPAVQPGTHAP